MRAATVPRRHRAARGRCLVTGMKGLFVIVGVMVGFIGALAIVATVLSS
jgi:hypothetical protein